MSEQPATYRPSHEVHAIYRELLAETMAPCTCSGDQDGNLCFRWAERGTEPALCTACASGYHAHSTGHGGYGAVVQAAVLPPSPSSPSPPTMTTCWACSGCGNTLSSATVAEHDCVRYLRSSLQAAEGERDARTHWIEQALPVVAHGEMRTVCVGCNLWEQAAQWGLVVSADLSHGGQESRQHAECLENWARVAAERDTLRAAVTALHNAVERAQQERDAVQARLDAGAGETSRRPISRQVDVAPDDDAADLTGREWMIRELNRQDEADALLALRDERNLLGAQLGETQAHAQWLETELARVTAERDEAEAKYAEVERRAELLGKRHVNVCHALADRTQQLNAIRHLIRECVAQRVPFSAVVAAAGEA